MHARSNQLEAQLPRGQGPRLDNIAEDVQYIIAAELANTSPPSIFALAQSSHSLRQAALPFIYRVVVLTREEDEAKKQEAYEALIGQFRGRGKCSIAHHVRSLVIKDEIPTDDLMMILDTIDELGVLQKLSWETTAHIPPRVLDKLHHTWPDLELTVHVLLRKHSKNHVHRQMDGKLLSSSLLRSLTYEVIYEGYQADHPASQEWAKITRAISAGGNLRMLKVHMKECREEPENDSQVELSRDRRLPALEEFTLYGAYSYNWSDDHCRMLADSVDLSTLHTLNLSSGMPTTFFKAFTGRLPGLKTLRVEIRRNVNVDSTASFISAVNTLQSLDIDGPTSVVDILWPAIVQHRATLTDICLRKHVSLGRLEEIMKTFPSVKRLGWNVPYEDQSNYLGFISCMKLERLQIFLHLPGTSSNYCGELIAERMGEMRSPALDKEGSQAAAVAIMQNLTALEGHKIERLTLHLMRTACWDRGDPYKLWAKLQVRQHEHPGKQVKFEFLGKQRWTYEDEVEEELELDWPVAL